METPTTPRSTLNPPVFYTSAALILALVLFTVLLQEEAQSLFNHVQQWIITNASWVAAFTATRSPASQKPAAPSSITQARRLGFGTSAASVWRMRQISQSVMTGTTKPWA